MSRINASRGKYATLFFGCVLFHLAGTWSLPLVDRDEPRFAEASREMIQRADYVVPCFNNQLRLDKPPLTYWAQVASYRIFGESDFSARFPSAIAAALIALVMFGWGHRNDGARVGWWAAIIFTFSLQTFIHAKAAVADMWLVLFMTLAHWAGYELMGFARINEDKQTLPRFNTSTFRRPLFWWFLFYISLALGFLAKGPIAWTPLLTVGATIFYAPNLRLRRRFKFVRGIAFMLAIIALWGIPALIQTHGEFLRIGIGRHVIQRSLGAMEGHGWNSLGGYILLLPFYLVTVFASFFPWSFKLPLLVKRLWRNRDGVDCYLFSGAAIIFIIFSLVKTKLPHYTLPAFSLLALLLARHWREDPAVGNRWSLFKTIAVATACGWIAIALVVPPFVARFFPAYQLFRESRDYLQPNMQFASVEFEEPSVVWYFRSRVQGFLTRLNKKNAVDFMSNPGPRFVIVPTSLVQTLFPEHSQTTFSTRGFNIAKGRQVDLTLVLKPE